VRRGARAWVAAYLGVVAAFVATVATYYHPDFGFTRLIEFSLANHESEIAAVRDTPHYDDPASVGYDGQFYAQLAVDPLLRDPTIDKALDTPPYRARRILMPWLSHAIGLGRPAAVLEVYALHAVAAWLLLAWLITRWIRPTTGRGFVLASTALLAHGPLMSVRYALPDLAAALLVAAGVLALERGRPWLAAVTLGVAGLARDTALVAATGLAGFLRRSTMSWVTVVACAGVAAMPLLLWFDYIHSIYRSTAFEGTGLFAASFAGLRWKIGMIVATVGEHGLTWQTFEGITALTAFLAQCGWLLWLFIRHRDRSPWLLTALGFIGLAVVAGQPIWEGIPGAYPRILIPVMLAAHVTLARRAGLWWLVALISLDVVAGVRLLAGSL